MAYTIIKQISSGILRYRALIDLEEGTISYCYGDFDEVFRSRMRKFEPLARSPSLLERQTYSRICEQVATRLDERWMSAVSKKLSTGTLSKLKEMANSPLIKHQHLLLERKLWGYRDGWFIDLVVSGEGEEPIVHESVSTVWPEGQEPIYEKMIAAVEQAMGVHKRYP